MSVINRMLQELESRHEQPEDKLPGIVRAVPPPARPRRELVLAAALGAALVVAIAGGTWLALRPASPAPSATPAPGGSEPAAQPAWPQPLKAPTEALVTETALAAPPVASPAPARAAPATEPSSAADDETSARRAPQTVDQAPAPAAHAPASAAEAAAGIKQISPAQRADRRYREALALIGQGRATEAQAALEEALRDEPRHLGARQALLGVLVEDRRIAEAERVLQEGLALDLAPASLAMALARLQMDRGDQGAALATLERYLAQGQGSADYQAFVAALLQRAERHAEAIGHYQAALRLQPARAVWWMGLGISLQAERREAEAVQAFERARTLPGLNAELLAFVEQRLRQLQQAQ